MSKKILLFTGAGFCVPFGMPVTTGFNDVMDRYAGGHLRALLHSYLGSRFYDVEDVLSTLELFLYNKTLLKNILDPNSHNPADNMHAWTTEINKRMRIYRSDADTLVFQLKRSIFSLLTTYNKDVSELQYGNLLTEIKTAFPECSLSIFTTNYDLSFEDAQDSLESIYNKLGVDSVEDGFLYKQHRTTFFDPGRDYSWRPDVIEYKKLHGSLDWTMKDNRCAKSNIVVAPEDPTKMLLLYPGFKGTPNDEPYKSLHDQLLQRLLTADIVFAVGFAFRDDYINSQFDTALKINPNLKVFCYNPTKIADLPLGQSKIPYFAKTYKDKFIHVVEKITPEDNPLAISHTTVAPFQRRRLKAPMKA